MILFLLMLLASPAGAQTAPRFTYVRTPGNVVGALSVAYDPKREKLWCVTKWTLEEQDEYRLATVLEVRPVDKSGQATDREIEMTGDECRASDGTAQPTIHSHPTGACQASPNDHLSAVNRRSPFDGVLCGDRFLVWYFAEHAIAIWHEQERAARSPNTPQ